MNEAAEELEQEEPKEITIKVDIQVDTNGHEDVSETAILGLSVIALARSLVATAKETTASMYDIIDFIEAAWDDEDEVPAE